MQLGAPTVRCRMLSVAPLEGHEPEQTWPWLLQALEGLGAVEAPPEVSDREGFGDALQQAFRAIEEGSRQCLMVHDLQALHPDTLADLVAAFQRHSSERSGPAGFNLVLTGPPGVPELPPTDERGPAFAG